MSSRPVFARPLRVLAFAGFVLALPCAASAADFAPQGADQSQIVAPVKGVAALDVFVSPDDAQRQRSVSARTLRFPLEVLDSDGDFLQVRLDGQLVWLDGNQVSVSRSVTDTGCRRVAGPPPLVAGLQGASKGCR